MGKNKKKLIIIGAGGHGCVVADIALQCNTYEQIVFLDDRLQENLLGFPVLGKVIDFRKYLEGWEFFVAIGDNRIRGGIFSELIKSGANIATLVHPKSYIGSKVKIGKGTVVMAGAVVNPLVVIGDSCIINTCASIDHGCIIGDYTHISVGAHLAGNIKVGNYVFTGIGTTLKNGIAVCDDCIIGAGAVVVKDIKETGVYIGIPAKRFNK